MAPLSLIATNASPQSLIVWQQCGTFNGHGNFVSLGCYTWYPKYFLKETTQCSIQSYFEAGIPAGFWRRVWLAIKTNLLKIWFAFGFYERTKKGKS